MDDGGVLIRFPGNGKEGTSPRLLATFFCGGMAAQSELAGHRRRCALRGVFEGRHSGVGGVQYLHQMYGGCDRITTAPALTRRGGIAKKQILMHPDECDRRDRQTGECDVPA